MSIGNRIAGVAAAVALVGMIHSPAVRAERDDSGSQGGFWAGHHGMMGGYGYGPGMMGGYGPGYGMMGGWGMGPGMMGGWGPEDGWGPELGLSDSQRKKLETIQSEARQAGSADWKAMAEVHQKMYAATHGAKLDRAAAKAAFGQMSALVAKQFERSLDLQEKVDAVLTDKQREALRSGGCGGVPGRMMDRR